MSVDTSYSQSNSSTTAFTIKDKTEVNQKAAEDSIKRIHASVNWEHYDGWVIGQKTLSFACKQENPDHIVGYISYTISRNSAYIPFIAVDKKAQEKGAGRALMLHTIEKIQELGVKELTLNYRGNNPKTDHFYKESVAKAAGLTFTFDSSGSYPNGDPSVRLTYNLTPASSSEDDPLLDLRFLLAENQ